MASAWTGRQRGGVIGHWLFHQLLRWLGRDAAGWLLYPVSFYFTLTTPRGVKASRRYLDQAGYYWNETRTFSVYQHFLAFSQVLLDRAALFSGWEKKFTFTFDGEDYIHSALAQGKGLLMLSGHLGNWEVAGRALHERVHIPVQVAMVQAEAERLQAFFAQHQDPEYRVLALENNEAASFGLLAALRQGEVVAMHADRFLPGSRSRRLPFLGRPAAFPEGPFQLAAVAGCPLIICFTLRTGKRSYRLKAYPAMTLLPDRSQRESEIQRAMQQYVAHLENTLKSDPLQWFNYYNFWA